MSSYSCPCPFATLQSRAQLAELKTNLSDLVMTQANTWMGKTVKFALNSDAYTNITSEMFDLFPKVTKV